MKYLHDLIKHSFIPLQMKPRTVHTINLLSPIYYLFLSQLSHKDLCFFKTYVVLFFYSDLQQSIFLYTDSLELLYVILPVLNFASNTSNVLHIDILLHTSLNEVCYSNNLIFSYFDIQNSELKTMA